MSLPDRPAGRQSYTGPARPRNSQLRDENPDMYTDSSSSPSGHGHHRAHSNSSLADTITSPIINPERMPLASSDIMHTVSETETSSAIGRKRSLVRPERNRITPDHPNYYYRKHAVHSSNVDVHPSSTGNDPILEDEISVDDSTTNTNAVSDNSTRVDRVRDEKKIASQRLEKRRSKRNSSKASKSKKAKPEENAQPLSLWMAFCYIVTFWVPNFVLGCCGMSNKDQKRAWREKMGLITIIVCIMAIVGFLTFGFNEVVCGSPPERLRINEVDGGYMIFHGKAYSLVNSAHPVAEGIPASADGDGANVLFDLPEPQGGKDGSFLFQNVNGRCKNIITLADGSDIPINSDNDLAWYFPCRTFNQDGSSSPNSTEEYYLGYACHTTANARHAFYKDLNSDADVYFTWDDLRNSSRNLVVYSGQVLDLNLLNWLDDDKVSYPDTFRELRNTSAALNQALRGRDITRMFQSSNDKHIAQCLQEIITVGSIDTKTVGCIAAKIVLYSMLVLILAVVMSRFCLAIIFQWFISPNYAADKTSQASDPRKRQKQIEDWSRDIYSAAPRIPGGVNSSVSGSDRANKRTSFLPTTSRFSAVYGIDRSVNSQKRMPTTMSSQGGSSLPQSSSIYRGGNDSRTSFLHSDAYGNGSTATAGPGPAGFIHDGVVPQPPADYMPFGFPLAHTMCLVTAYSEGYDGLRTTMDSIATTDYPNSHKVMVVICDGDIRGKGEQYSTPEIVLGMMTDLIVPADEVQAYSYVAVASGSKRHNMAKVYCGFYDYGTESSIPIEKQQRVPVVTIVKCGTPAEQSKPKAGNRGKRDSQIILMSFLQKVMFDERMTELEYEMFNGLWRVTGISPDFYEIMLMVDADTKVFPDSLTHMVSAMVKDPDIMGLCGETKIANKRASWVSAIQVFEYFVSHHLAKSFESVFGGVTCLPGCFCMYRIKAPKGTQNYWVPILANPDIVEHYSDNVIDTLHRKNLLLLGEDRYLTTLMLRTFPKRKQVFVPQAVCKTTVPDEFMVLLSQRRRWINSTVHNLMELILVRDLCGTFCFSMQFVVFIELMGTLVLPAAIAFTFYVVIVSIVNRPVQVIPLVLLGLILGLPGLLIVITAHSLTYVGWMIIYLISLPIWNFVLPTYAFWKFDDFSWGDTRQTSDGLKEDHEHNGEFDSSQITMKRWAEFERERRMRVQYWASRENVSTGHQGGQLSPMGWAHNQGYQGDYYNE
ncbi:Chitin synthase, class 3 [Ceratocystis pirilliformis]|uniref:chitin synthase n=1 Tax=Ceratocystis pirilliformis TaxID=259994 RepID=A0ABR3ZM84_9PEZI